ncbi:MAG: IS200/IS605 family transposase [Chitinophagaceae bacterium]|nr:MAG: IS200/IS605 family transposase [Chitinophagaceae bacterium]
MTDSQTRTFLFIHVIWTTAGRVAVLKKPVRTILFAYLQKSSEEKGIKILALNGVEDHLHIVLQLQPAQNLSQVVKSLKTDSAGWIISTNLLGNEFEWQNNYAAYTVSPSGLKQVIEFVGNQETYHQTKTLESELAVFDKNYFE